MMSLQRDFTPDDLAPELKAIGFDGTVAVQARQMLEETDWLLFLSEQYGFIQGVVGWVDFASSALDEHLERFAAHPKFKGVRELIHDMADLEYATSNVHLRGLSRLERLGLTYDLLLKPPHIRPAIELVRGFPNQLFVVDHIGKPEIGRATYSPWAEDMNDLAGFDNVYCKLSGMVTEAEWDNWQPQDFRRYLDIVLDAFGADRLMIGSDWPVCTLSGSYEGVMKIVVDYVSDLSEEERDRILGDNCACFYDIAEVETTTSDSVGVWR